MRHALPLVFVVISLLIMTVVASEDVHQDTDGDGLSDGNEVTFHTDPLNPDTDGDGLSDGQELHSGTNPTLADTDGDGLSDGGEGEHATDPSLSDTDADRFDDGSEVAQGTDPLNQESLPPSGAKPVVEEVQMNPEELRSVRAGLVSKEVPMEQSKIVAERKQSWTSEELEKIVVAYDRESEILRIRVSDRVKMTASAKGYLIDFDQ